MRSHVVSEKAECGRSARGKDGHPGGSQGRLEHDRCATRALFVEEGVNNQVQVEEQDGTSARGKEARQSR